MRKCVDIIFSISAVIAGLVVSAQGDYYSQILEKSAENTINWCCIGEEELKKCEAFSKSVLASNRTFGGDFLFVGCVSATSKEECMYLIEEEKATLTTLDAGEVFVGGRYFSTVPILRHIYTDQHKYYYSVAVIKKGGLPDVSSLYGLRGKKACFTEVGTLAGWVLPINMLMKRGGLQIADCNNHVKNAIQYFGPSCAVNSLADKYNPIGDNSDKLCQLCIGKVPGGKCTRADPYAGFNGAFRCLLEAGEIAFLKHTTVSEMISDKAEFPSVNQEDFELLCEDGSRRPVADYENCNWGRVQSAAIVASSAKSAKTRRIYQRFLQRAVQIFGPTETRINSTRPAKDPYETPNRGFNDFYGNNQNQNKDVYNRDRDRDRSFDNFDGYSSTEQSLVEYETFNMFESAPRYGRKRNLLFEDYTSFLEALPENAQTFSSFLGESLEYIYAIRDCPVRTMTLCVTSDAEMEKCHKMRVALRAQLLKPEMSCYKGHSHIHCMQAIRNGDADVTLLDAGDVYTAGLNYNLIPIMAEIYNLNGPEYYVVAVSKEEDPDTEITYLKGKNMCSGGTNTAAGWVIPLAYIISNGWMRNYGCYSMRAAAEYFSKACVPGALSSEYNTEMPYENMCHLCHGRSYSYCRRDASEDYYGHTGAFRCLVEGGGHVAFVKHTTVLENTDGKRKEWWARNTLNEDFQLLCPDGTRAPLSRYPTCNLGKAKSNAIVTRGGEAYNGTQQNAYINLFTYAQQFYGRKQLDDFNFAMFVSEPPYADLIFQDATTQLQVIPNWQRWYSDYLGGDFLRAKRIVDCYAGVSAATGSLALVLSSLVLSVLVSTK
ncbi:TR_FER [Nesidiocoris tenuis]|uniref:TR_FER n=1 Tax=Nesidiocoris tenuis TaxID=355587 RepID=A0ABN7AX62_9HEMI|nr:TR_FER [Nesidiocoris tenuis]